MYALFAQSGSVAATTARFGCCQCWLRSLCRGAGLSEKATAQLEALIECRKSLGSGESLYRINSPFRSLYFVRSGGFKAYSLSSDGEERISRFYLPGDVIGLEAIDQGRYPGAVQALGSSSVCELPYRQLELLAREETAIQRWLLSLMSREIAAQQQQMSLISKRCAQARLAALLLQLSRRQQDCGLSKQEFELRMSRHDIGNYLGLTTETVSRLFTQFKNLGVIAVQRKQIRIDDLTALLQLSGESDLCLEAL